MADGGTIHIIDTFCVPAAFEWKNHHKTITIAGDVLDFTKYSDVVMGDDIIFDDLTLNVNKNMNLFANGYKLEIETGVQLTNVINVYGGGPEGTIVASTDVTLKTGNYYRIYGGGLNSTVEQDTNLVIGGDVNVLADAASHAATYNIYGAGNGGVVKGTANVTFTDNAKANYLYGGCEGSGKVSKTNLVFSGGQIMSITGGNASSSEINAVSILVEGGTVQQLFGGNNDASMEGTVDVQVLGGTITRRIYGGCYNEYGSGWESSHYVKGTITLTLGSDANITLDAAQSDGSLYNDRSIYARSRQSTVSKEEKTTIIYKNKAAYVKFKNSLKAQDWAMQLIMHGVSACDSTNESEIQ